MLLASCLRRAYHVPLFQRSCRGFAAEAAAIGDRVFLPACQVPDRGKLRTVVRPHGRVQ